MKTKQQVIDFLESKLGTEVPCKGNPSLDGQCVTLVKALLEFLGASDPYKARGHAKTAISAYLKEGIADPGPGFISVFSNKNMAGGYGHIWVNVGEGEGTYYESNGVKALTVTKGKTYSYDTVCNLDKYLKKSMKTYSEEEMTAVRLERDRNWDKFKAAEKELNEYKTSSERTIDDLESQISYLEDVIIQKDEGLGQLLEDKKSLTKQLNILKAQISSHKCEVPTVNIDSYSVAELLGALFNKFLNKKST